MKTLTGAAALASTLLWGAAHAQVNAGDQQPERSMPFTMTEVTTLRLPWRIAFLPDGRMLITEKVGGLALVTQSGETNTPSIPPWRS